MTEKNELTGKQRAFVNAWFGCRFNGVEAAKQAGYRGDYWTLAAIASENLKKPKIRDEIDHRWKIHGVSAEEVMATWAKVARGDVSIFYTEAGVLDWNKVREHGDLIESIEWDRGSKLKIKLYSKQAALDSIARSLGMFKDKIEVINPITFKVVYDDEPTGD